MQTSIGTSRLRSKVLISNENFSFELQATPNSLEFFSYLNKLLQYLFENFQDYVFPLSLNRGCLLITRLVYVYYRLLSIVLLIFSTFFIDFPLPDIYNVNQKRGDGMNRRIKEIRSALGLTQQEFADRLSLKRNTIATYEMGKASPSDRTINDICDKYNVNETWLRTGKGEMFNELPEEDEVAAYVSELLEDDEGNPLYDIIKEIMHTYSELTPKSQEVIRDFSAQLLKNLKEKGD